jgi:hypothetical protein
MDWEPPIQAGETCRQCEKGTMTLEARALNRRRPGHTDMYFRCAECRAVIMQTQDDRFIP